MSRPGAACRDRIGVRQAYRDHRPAAGRAPPGGNHEVYRGFQLRRHGGCPEEKRRAVRIIVHRALKEVRALMDEGSHQT